MKFLALSVAVCVVAVSISSMSSFQLSEHPPLILHMRGLTYATSGFLPMLGIIASQLQQRETATC